MFNKISKAQKGFTLLEIMIVIGIMAMLFSIVIPSFQKARDQAKLSVCMENVKNMATAVEIYAMDNKLNPPIFTTPGEEGLQLLVDLKYMKSIPPEPVYGQGGYSYHSVDFASGVKIYTIMCGPTDTDQNHGVVGIGPGRPCYSPLTGQETGIGI